MNADGALRPAWDFVISCVKTKLSSRKWTHWYKLPFIDYNDGAATVPTKPVEVALGSRLLKKGMIGSDVKAMQELLMQIGYPLPKYGADTDFGEETEEAVIAFQQAEGLEVDGKYGEKTHAALMDAVADADAGQLEETPAPDAGEGEAPAPEDGNEDLPEEAKPAGTTVVIVAVNGGKVNIRKGNGTEYGRISTVASGTAFEHVATAANGWNAVVIGAQVGWVSGKYSRII